MTNQNNLLKKSEYFSEYYRLYDGKKKQYQIWMKLESRLLEKYGINMYPTLGSFKTAKSRYEKELQGRLQV